MNNNLTIQVNNQIKQLVTLPNGLLEANPETLQAIYELENNINASHYNNVDEFKKDLGW